MATERPKRALLVEKDSIESITTEVILQHLGFQVQRAKQGMEGVIRATFDVPDLILMSIDMNCGDKPAIDALRAQNQTANTWTIAIMEKTSQEFDEHVRALGFDGHICRPVGLRDLEDAIHCLGQNRASPLR